MHTILFQTHHIRFTIQNVPIKSLIYSNRIDQLWYLQYKMFLLNHKLASDMKKEIENLQYKMFLLNQI